MLSDIQKEILNGTMLGDASIGGPTHTTKKARMKIERCCADKAYLEAVYEYFKDLCNSGINCKDRFDKRYQKTYCSTKFRTRCNQDLYIEYLRWYPGNGSKIVPRDLVLTPLSLAIWFADDGHICAKDGKKSCRMKFSTESFTLDDVKFLIQQLKNVTNQDFMYCHKDEKNRPDQYVIYGNSEQTRPTMKLISPYLLQFNMERKVYDIEDYTKQLKKQLHILNFVKENPNCSLQDIYNNLDLDYHHIRSLLTIKDYVIFTKSIKDGRNKTYKISESGLHFLENHPFKQEFQLKSKRTKVLMTEQFKNILINILNYINEHDNPTRKEIYTALKNLGKNGVKNVLGFEIYQQYFYKKTVSGKIRELEYIISPTGLQFILENPLPYVNL